MTKWAELDSSVDASSEIESIPHYDLSFVGFLSSLTPTPTPSLKMMQSAGVVMSDHFQSNLNPAMAMDARDKVLGFIFQSTLMDTFACDRLEVISCYYLSY